MTRDIQKLYLAYFGRPADSLGLSYWLQQANAGLLDLAGTARSFAQSAEYQANYAGLSDSALVDRLYLTLFDRLPDSEGAYYWLTELATGRLTVADMALALLNGARGEDLTLLNQRLQVAQSLTPLLTAETDSQTPSADWSMARLLLQQLDGSNAALQAVLAGVSSSDAFAALLAPSVSEPITQSPSRAQLNALSFAFAPDYGVALSLPSSISYGFDSTRPADQNWTVNWQPMNASQQNAVLAALAYYESILDVRFTPVSADGLISFAQADSQNDWAGITELLYANDGRLTDVNVLLAADYEDTQSPTARGVDGFGYLTVLHELGHALGLKHPFEGSARLPTAQDNYDYSIMSYTDHEYGSFVQYEQLGSKFLTTTTASLLDIAYLQQQYGANTDTASGDDVYGFDTFATRQISLYDASLAQTVRHEQPVFHYTLWDAGGVDTLDVSWLSLPSEVDLTDGRFSSIGLSPISEKDWYAGKNNLAIAYGVVIERFVGGSADDKVLGNSADNRLQGNAGNDRLTGGAGADEFVFVAATHGLDTITDFVVGEDKLLFDASGFGLSGDYLYNHWQNTSWGFSLVDGLLSFHDQGERYSLAQLTGVNTLSMDSVVFI